MRRRSVEVRLLAPATGTAGANPAAGRASRDAYGAWLGADASVGVRVAEAVERGRAALETLADAARGYAAVAARAGEARAGEAATRLGAGG